MKLVGKKLQNCKNSYAYDLVRLLCLKTPYTSESKLVIDLVKSLSKLSLSDISNLNMLVKLNIEDRRMRSDAFIENDNMARTKRFLSNHKYTKSELENKRTLSVGQASNLKVEDYDHNPPMRVWLSRMTVADGMPFNNAIEVEYYLDGRWIEVERYEG